MAEIKDSGNRREFTTGAVRDIQEGKGAEYLLPLDIVAQLLHSDIIDKIYFFTQTDSVTDLYNAVYDFSEMAFDDIYSALMQVAIHFEDGARKYGERNWEKGIPTHCYIDSALRHFLKYRRGDTDERHDRAFLWNLLCCAWTAKNHPELDDYRRDKDDGAENSN